MRNFAFSHAPITREELAAVLARTVALRNGTPGFTDAGAVSGAVNYVLTVLREDWMRGDPDGRFRPGDGIIRAEVATAINRTLDRADSNEALPPIQNPADARDFADVHDEAWYFASVLAVANDHRNRVHIDTGDVVVKVILVN